MIRVVPIIFLFAFSVMFAPRINVVCCTLDGNECVRIEQTVERPYIISREMQRQAEEFLFNDSDMCPKTFVELKEFPEQLKQYIPEDWDVKAFKMLDPRDRGRFSIDYVPDGSEEKLSTEAFQLSRYIEDKIRAWQKDPERLDTLELKFHAEFTRYADRLGPPFLVRRSDDRFVGVFYPNYIGPRLVYTYINVEPLNLDVDMLRRLVMPGGLWNIDRDKSKPENIEIIIKCSERWGKKTTEQIAEFRRANAG